MSDMRVLLLVFSIVLGLPTCILRGQVVLNSPPTVIPFQGSYPIEGGTILNAYEGAEIHARLGIQDGGTLNLRGAHLSQGVTANSGATVNIFDGNITGSTADFLMGAGSTTIVRGGRFSRTVLKQSGATLIMEGVDFELNGIPIPGLSTPGDETSIAIPVDTLFTGIFFNGSPFTFSHNSTSGDRFYGELILRQSARPTGPAVVNVPGEALPTGVLPGQTLNVSDGARLPEAMNAAPGSTVNFVGGDAGLFELYGAHVNVNSGDIWILRAYTGSTIEINGGTTSQVSASGNTAITMNGGTLGSLNISLGNNVEINGGVVERLRMLEAGTSAIMRGGTISQEVRLVGGSTFYIEGGVIDRSLGVPAGAQVMVSGGSIAESALATITTAPNATLVFRGRAFTLDGEPIPGLEHPGDSIVFADRPDKMLDAILADGTPLSLYIGTVFQQVPPRDRIDPASTLRLILIPEPHTLALASLVMLLLILRRALGTDLS